MSWRGWLAALLLLLGVAMAVDSAAIGPRWLALPSFLCLAFVVPLTVDEARRR